LKEDFLKHNPYFPSLQERVHAASDLEAKLDAFRLFKREKQEKLEREFFADPETLVKTMRGLTDLADASLMAAYLLARQELKTKFGYPAFKDKDANYMPCDFAIIGMGKLGGRELHVRSDLDLIYVFSRNGETQGASVLTNQEYYSKLAQRLISYLLVYTRYGYAYKVDTELRPSGNAGALVTCLDTWTTYYHEQAALWEKQALLKARLLFASGSFDKEFKGLFHKLIFLTPFPENFSEQIHHLKTRIEKELAKEGPRRWHYKKGAGGLMDIEFTLQYLQLKLGKVFDNILSPNTLDGLERFARSRIRPPEEMLILREAYLFYRKMEIFLELKFSLHEGYLDPYHECIPELASWMSFGSPGEFLEVFSGFRKQVRGIYERILQVKDDEHAAS